MKIQDSTARPQPLATPPKPPPTRAEVPAPPRVPEKTPEPGKGRSIDTRA